MLAVRDLDRLGNNGADEAADFGRRRVPWWVIDARRNFSGVCSRWRPIVLSLHRFFIAISRAVVIMMVLLVLLLVGWQCSNKRRVAVRDRAWMQSWCGVVCLMWSCSCCMNFGQVERLELEKAVPRYRRPGRSISVSAVPFGPGTDIWRSCRFIGALFRGLRACLLVLTTVGCGILGGKGAVMVLLPGPKSLRLRTFWTGFWFCLVIRVGPLLRYWLDFLPLRYCSSRLACRFPTWRLPDMGHVCELVTDGVVDDRFLG